MYCVGLTVEGVAIYIQLDASGRRCALSAVESDLPVVDNIDDVIVLVAVNVRGFENLMARITILFIDALSESAEVEVLIQLAVVVETRPRRLQAVVLIIPFCPVPSHVRVPKLPSTVDVKRFKTSCRSVITFSRRIKPL